MKLSVAIKLLPEDGQTLLLRQTLARANAACNYASGVAFSTGTFRQFDLQKLVYFEIRERFKLTAQMAIRCIARVAQAYKKDRKTTRVFRPYGAIPYDDRILSFKSGDRVSSGRSKGGRSSRSSAAMPSGRCSPIGKASATCPEGGASSFSK